MSMPQQCPPATAAEKRQGYTERFHVTLCLTREEFLLAFAVAKRFNANLSKMLKDDALAQVFDTALWSDMLDDDNKLRPECNPTGKPGRAGRLPSTSFNCVSLAESAGGFDGAGERKDGRHG